MGNTISTCIIIKNEIENIPYLVDDLRQFSDEIIIVDTGSTDGTYEWLQKQDDIILKQFKWINDFAAARNESFKYATKDWIFWCDADDRISEDLIKDIKKLKKSLSKSKIDAYVMNYKFTEYLDVPRNRLIRRNDNVKWTGKCHEYVMGSPWVTDNKYFYKNKNSNIIHKRDVLLNPNKHSDRNLKIFMWQLLDLNANISTRDLYYYINELRDNGFLDKAVSLGEKQLFNPEMQVFDIYSTIVHTLMRKYTQDYDTITHGTAVIQNFVNKTTNPIRGDIYGALATLYYSLNHKDTAKEYAKLALETKEFDVINNFAYEPYYGKEMPKFILEN